MVLRFHGLDIAVTGDWPEVIDDVRGDFGWFETRTAGLQDVAVTIQRRPPAYEAVGDVAASFITPRNVVYQDRGRTLIDYFGRALSVYDRGRGEMVVQGEDPDLVHEAVYQFILSRAGMHLEEVGLTRLHALGLAGRRGGVAVLLPSGGGKSTLALSALADARVKLLSEDSPLLDRRGTLYPFPLRLGVNEIDAHRLPAGRTRTLSRMEFGRKTVLELDALADRIEPCPQPLRHLVLGERTLGTQPSLEPIARRRLIKPLLRECVVGVGIYQGMEFVLQRGLRDVLGELGPIKLRTECSAGALAKAQTWRLRIGRDHEANWASLARLLG